MSSAIMATELTVDEAIAALYPEDVYSSPSSSSSLSPAHSLSSSCTVNQRSPFSDSGPTLASSPPNSFKSPADTSGGTDSSYLTLACPNEAQLSRRMWTQDEQVCFLEALPRNVSVRQVTGLRDERGRLRVGLGRGAARRIAEAVGTRSEAQVRSHAQKFFEQAERGGRDWRGSLGM
ncbi:hypothetical protein GUITHDRAFT_116156 [Guillardia theta CCMP2712]|uniref:Myb-like domain-containing protein n=1 Tax=Guillardia theta (strain CCMP2712) TaxID=905079 RepID=L1IP66_GUITC|nr:hypothetical protein GUITHDRAFT_116156 [Guillardia theta CCMP2712]EKX37679.1 hypothetical protein GUITHDRAFT_116156 [Guillardia theta CCMP2712]|eukprot:XP_005824659.1 hypothetical protein GUITHDRAFT_116156 [Guillardia theta CCMP2712]